VNRVVLVEDRKTTRLMVEETLRRRGLEVASGGTVARGRELLEEAKAGLLLTDLQLPDGSGLDLLDDGLAGDPRLPVIVMSAYGTIEIAVEAIKRGAYDFVPKPFDTNRLADLVANALERRPRAADSLDGVPSPPTPDTAGIVAASPAMREVLAVARKVATSDATVLISGESGTGKELVARAIHDWSGRAAGPLVDVNCAAIPAELMEAEFFGSERGSFTGSVARKLGKVELATGGTLFLDEIGELPGPLQAKLLRVLQERTLTRIGGTVEVQTDARVIAATNRDLEALVGEGRFRDDLYYRLNVFPIRIPPLRERPEDVPVLAVEFARECATKLDRPGLALSDEALTRLEAGDWPGNVRELRNVVERAAILADGNVLRPEHLEIGTPAGPALVAAGAPAGALPDGATLLDIGRDAARRAESEAILRVLDETGGNKTEAARRLGISYKTLWSKLKEYELG
jgi:two-component system response regulator FlrC